MLLRKTGRRFCKPSFLGLVGSSVRLLNFWCREVTGANRPEVLLADVNQLVNCNCMEFQGFSDLMWFGHQPSIIRPSPCGVERRWREFARVRWSLRLLKRSDLRCSWLTLICVYSIKLVGTNQTGRDGLQPNSDGLQPNSGLNKSTKTTEEPWRAIPCGKLFTFLSWVQLVGSAGTYAGSFLQILFASPKGSISQNQNHPIHGTGIVTYIEVIFMA